MHPLLVLLLTLAIGTAKYFTIINQRNFIFREKTSETKIFEKKKTFKKIISRLYFYTLQNMREGHSMEPVTTLTEY